MKVVTTNGLTKLIQLIKDTFLAKSDTTQASTVTLATVATSGSYNDLSNKPTVDQTYSGTSTNAQSGVAVKSAIDSAISTVYKPAGTVAFSSLPTPSSSNLGNVYDVSNEFTTDSRFVEGSGKTYPAHTNVVIVNTSGSTYKFDVLSGLVDLSSYQPLLVSGSNIKTVNSQSLLGSGNITINSLPSQSGNSGKFLTTDGTDASWTDVYAMQIIDYTANEINGGNQGGSHSSGGSGN